MRHNTLIYSYTTVLKYKDINGLLFFYRQNFEQVIHPESEENVQNVREEIHHQRETNHSTSANGVGPDTQTGPTQRPITANHGDLQCPVCLTDAQFAVQTNCGHIFCGKIRE